jgi:glycosyltransferase involved in cell wall biosynthesis
LVKDKTKIRFFPNSAEDILVESTRNQRDVSVAKDIADNFSLVFAGNIGKAQSCETIVEAANLLQDAHNIKFYLVGNGSMAESISQKISDSSLGNVLMTGRVSAEDIASIYASASVLVLSLRDDPALSETIPSKLQSYLAAGKPIIVSSNGASANIVIKANAGLACPAGDAESLAKAVLMLYEMQPKKRAWLGVNGRNYFMAHYYLPDRVTELARHFEDIATHR